MVFPVEGEADRTPVPMEIRRIVPIGIVGATAMLTACATTESRQTTEVAALQSRLTSEPTELTAMIQDDTAAIDASAPAHSHSPGNIRLAPHIVATNRFLQCVPFARRESGLRIYGHAATWWQSAHGIYRRSKVPAVGAVMVFRSSRRNPYGHLAVVRDILDDRRIIVDHANWLNRGRVHRATPVVDVSRANDWSAVRVWYTPGERIGAHTFPVSGFVHSEQVQPGALFRTVARTNVRQWPSRSARRIARLPRQATVEFLERVTGRPWFRVGRNGRELGYVFAPLLKPLS